MNICRLFNLTFNFLFSPSVPGITSWTPFRAPSPSYSAPPSSLYGAPPLQPPRPQPSGGTRPSYNPPSSVIPGRPTLPAIR